MKFLALLGLFGLQLLFSGCAEIPFKDTAAFPLASLSPDQVVAEFRARTPEKISTLNSIVFEFAGQQFLGVGFLEAEAATGRFRAICLNPMGVKLFDLEGDGATTTVNFAMEPLASYGNIASAVAFDIKRIYFNLLPTADAMPRQLQDRIIFGTALPDGYLEHVFAGENGDLVEKRFYREQFIAWSVGYYEYGDDNGKSFPRGIILTDYQGGYRLIIREKEQNVEKDQE